MDLNYNNISHVLLGLYHRSDWQWPDFGDCQPFGLELEPRRLLR